MKRSLKLFLIGCMVVAAGAALAEPHVFVPVHWTLGTVSGPAGVAVDGRTVIFYKGTDPQTRITATVGLLPANPGQYVITTYGNRDIPINYTDNYYVAVGRTATDNYGADPVAITFTQGEGYKVVNLTLTAGGGPYIGALRFVTATPLPDGRVGQQYTATIQVEGGTSPYTYSGSNLPAGLSISGDGVISGTPTAAGHYTFTIQVTDANGATATQSYSLTIKGGPVVSAVPLMIARSGSSDIQLSWDNLTYPSIDIYYLDGDGTGKFDKAKDWEVLKAAAAGEKYLDEGQVGKGSNERYYKALIADSNKNANLPDAPAVGKVNVSLYGGWNLISAPFAADSADLILGANYQNDEQLWSWSDDKNKFAGTATFLSGAWTAGTNIDPGRGYWLNLSGTAVGTKKEITLIGSIEVGVSRSQKIHSGWDLIGSPFPRPDHSSGMAHGKSFKDDQIWVWDNQLKKFINTKSFDGTTWFPDAKLLPGRGYWYNHLGNGFDWQSSN